MSKLENYKGSVQLIAGITQKGGAGFSLVEANAVQVDENDTRLDEVITDLKSQLSSLSETLSSIQEQLSKLESVAVIIDRNSDGDNVVYNDNDVSTTE